MRRNMTKEQTANKGSRNNTWKIAESLSSGQLAQASSARPK
jgi:hypothetical protein